MRERLIPSPLLFTLEQEYFTFRFFPLSLEQTPYSVTTKWRSSPVVLYSLPFSLMGLTPLTQQAEGSFLYRESDTF